MTGFELAYDRMIESALRGVVREALKGVAAKGLPGEHHFYISFRTRHPGVQLSDAQRERFPDEITIVIQNQYWDLKVLADQFEVGLSFAGVPETVVVPFAAITAFNDPAAHFGLQFQLTSDAAPDADQPAAEAEVTATEPAKADDGSNVVALDRFRRK
ncbi:MAG: ClpXP protease specificity-enhancing factor SspB [Alphaproteobacteria bacterium]|nr:ClpXP protease specificity-enhancing factor SspB [Alphaproteobacteria bacterium]